MGLSNNSNAREATAACSGHSLLEGDVVTISGVTGDGKTQWSGTFRIYSVTTTSFKYWMPQAPSAAAGGSPTAAKVIFRFDDLMRRLSAMSNTAMRIHLGPGAFETRGYTEISQGNPNLNWQPKAGMKFAGSGIDVTTLKLVFANLSSGHYYAIGGDYNNLRDYLSVFDITVDCNLPGQPFTPGVDYADVTCSAIRVVGSFVRIRRVKAINWGAQTTAAEAFVIAVSGSHPDYPDNEGVNPIIEDCICVQPNEPINDPNSTSKWLGYWQVTEVDPNSSYVFKFKLNPLDLPPDAETVYNGPVRIGAFLQALSIGGCQGGIVEENSIHNAWIGGPYQDTYQSREIIVRRNYYKNVGVGHYSNLGGVDPAPRTLTITKAASHTAKATSPKHGFLEGQRVRIRRASFSGYNTAWTISSVTSDTFQFGDQTLNPPDTSDTTGFAVAETADLQSLTYLTGGYAQGLSPIGTPHNLREGDRIKVSYSDVPEFNGFFQITKIDDSFTFRYKLPLSATGLSPLDAAFQRVGGGRPPCRRGQRDRAAPRLRLRVRHPHRYRPIRREPDYSKHGATALRSWRGIYSR